MAIQKGTCLLNKSFKFYCEELQNKYVAKQDGGHHFLL